MNSRHMLLRLEAPLMSFGGVAVDNRGPVEHWPSASLCTGLLGNALGYRRTDTAKLQSLQERIRYAAACVRQGSLLTDFQTAELAKDDAGWTTRGVPETRAGGASTYASPHLRYREYWSDGLVFLAVKLTDTAAAPTLEHLAEAVQCPARPLFIGRKHCLPSASIFAGWAEGDSPLRALESYLRQEFSLDDPVPCFWSPADDNRPGIKDHLAYNRRNWSSGVHAGSELWREGRINPGDN